MKLSHDALRKMRIEAKLSQEEMADRMNIKQPNYNRLENGKTAIKHEHIPKIAQAVGKSHEEILGKLAGCIINNSINDTAQNNQNVVYYDVDKKVLDEKNVVIETQKQAISALNMTVKILYNKVTELEIKLAQKLRKGNRLSQTELAHLLNIPSQSKISSWENGTCIPYILESLLNGD
jgi:transcriptional regulator with XRE-family HTH domain